VLTLAPALLEMDRMDRPLISRIREPLVRSGHLAA
jgi:hypothetical protein